MIRGTPSGNALLPEARLHAAQHRRERHLIVLHRLGRLCERRESALEVEFPVRVIALYWLALFDIAGIERAIHDERTAYRRIPVQTDAIEVHDERIARNRAFHVKRPCQRIPAQGSAGSLGIGAAGIHRPRFDSIPRVNV